MTYSIRTISRTLLVASAAATVLVLVAMPSNASAQGGTARTTQQPAQPSLIGTWIGTATIPLPDSALVVPVTYTFTQGPQGITGTAFVPGQGTGPISAVVRDSTKIRFKLETPQGIVDHEGTFQADGSIKGMIYLDKQPVAEFRITKRAA